MESVWERRVHNDPKAFWPKQLKRVWPYTEMGFTEGGTNFALSVLSVR